jgi:uncharacterized heparinase superfamily protein
MPALSTYWHTLRHLRPEQVFGRLWFRISAPRIDTTAAPPLRGRAGGVWVHTACRRASLVGPERLFCLNEARSLDDHGWDDENLEKLWRYNLHYFDDLNAAGARDRADWHLTLLLRWVRENPPGMGTAWEPYPTSLRIVNWIKWALAGNALPNECIHSLAIQTRWLAGRIEWHLLGNHLFSNAKALLMAGLFFDGAEAADWQERAFRIIEREIPEQILEDGGHFERSTMYHALALEDMLDLCNATRSYPAAIPVRWRSRVERWGERVTPMLRWLSAMCHPDGEIGFFNDAAIGIAPSTLELVQYAARLGFSDSLPNQDLVSLPATGYIRVSASDVVALLDVAPIGPDYLPAHAHADTLSFELSVFGQRVLVNSGTSCYGVSAERLRQRGTAAHNTLVVDGNDSSEVWGAFRVARRARPIGLKVRRNDVLEVLCGHDGYRRLPGRPTHVRQWRFAGRELVLDDSVSGRFRKAQARFHLHPSVRLERLSESSVILRLPEQRAVQFSSQGGVLRSERSTWHPEFGRSEENTCLVVELEHDSIRTRLAW